MIQTPRSDERLGNGPKACPICYIIPDSYAHLGAFVTDRLAFIVHRNGFDPIRRLRRGMGSANHGQYPVLVFLLGLTRGIGCLLTALTQSRYVASRILSLGLGGLVIS